MIIPTHATSLILSSVFFAAGKNITLGGMMTGKSTSYSQDIQTRTNIYVDGFRIDTIETPKDDDDIREVAMTSAVIDLLEGREIATIVPVPTTYPRFIIITTEL